MAKTSKASRGKTLQEIQTPLGFYVLALLIIESTLCIVLTAAKFDQEYKWLGFLCMIGVFAAVLAIVTILGVETQEFVIRQGGAFNSSNRTLRAKGPDRRHHF